MSKQKKTLLWLEDLPETVADQLNFAKSKGFEVVQVANLPRFGNRLAQGDVHGIVLDIMIFGMYDLRTLGIDASTDGGYEAGWVLLESYLRDPDAPRQVREIPILILSSRRLTANSKYEDKLKALNQGAVTPVLYIEKGEQNCEAKFRDWLDTIIRVAQI